MINRHPWLVPLVAMIPWALPFNALASNACEPWVARIESVEGQVEARRVDQLHWQPVHLQEVFCAGDSIRVEALSRAAIRLHNETLLRLDQQTTITLFEIRAEEPSWLELLRGAVHFISQVPRTLKVRTPFVNAAIEGTEFALRVEPQQSALWVFAGRVLASNDIGSLLLTTGEAALARAGEAPMRRIVVRPRDAVQWALYYPPIIDTRPALYQDAPGAPGILEAISRYREADLPGAFAALEAVPADLREGRYFTLQAALLLSVGRVDEARSAIEQVLDLDPNNGVAFALQAIIAMVQTETDQALGLARQAVELDPQSSVPQVALSYAYQANFEIEQALEGARHAVQLDPEDALAWARLAELWLSTGHLQRALEAAQQAIARNPDLARTQTVLGFAHLTRIEIDRARIAFETAILLDQADPLPRLGLGLARIRQSNLSEGREAMETAASLDPNNSIIRSYLGKAYFEKTRDRLAAEQFDIAKELDPLDPTPWFYDAIRKQLQNRPVEALGDLEQSIALNDNRAVYRSRLLLDEDLAVRGISLARIFDDLGFDQRALVEASKSLSIDPANHSAHRFLSDTYARLPRHEIARVSELLQAQLLQPININPVQPRLAVADLNIVAGIGPAEAAFNEFTPLFERERLQLTASGIIGNNRTLGNEIVLSGITGRFSYSLGQFHYETDGFRENNDVKHDIYTAFAQAALTPRLNLQAEYRLRDTEQGDLRLNFDPDAFSREDRLAKREHTARLGARLAPSPRSDIIVSLIYQDGKEDQAIFAMIGNERVRFDLSTEDNGYQAEAQLLYRTDRFNLTLGTGTYETDVDRRIVRTPPGPPPPEAQFTREADSLYGYANVHLLDNLIGTVGLSYESYAQQNLDLSELNPKVGLQWDVTDSLRLRLAAFETVKRALIVDQTIEPTQVAGFNQFFDDLNGTQARRYGIGLDIRPTATLYGGVEASSRDLRSPIGVGTQNFAIEDHREDLYRAYLYWTPLRHWALSAEYQFEKLKLDVTQLFGRPTTRIETMSVPLAARYFNPLGVFAEFGMTYVHQEVDLPPTATFTTDRDDFVLVDAAVGYRFPKRRGIISLEARNLLDKEFLFQDDYFRTSEIRNPRFIPNRAVLGRITFNF